MEFRPCKIKKTLGIIICAILVFVILILLFLSPIAKYAIEKYDEKLIGRQISLNRIYINPFTGYIQINNPRVFENKSDSVFFSAKGISLNVEISKLFSKTFEISELILDKPVGVIVQNGKALNFDDLINKFSPKNKAKKNAGPVKVSILNVKINDGTFYYTEKTIPVFYFIKHVNINSNGKRWNVDTIPFKFSFASGIGSGNVKGETCLHLGSMDYRIAVVVNKYDLSSMEQYIKNISNYGSLRATIDADIKATGNLKNRQKLEARGLFSINDLHFGKSKSEDYLSFKKFSVKIHRLNPLAKKYFYDSVSLKEPYFKYERYDHLDNLQTMFGKKGEKIKAAKASTGNVNILFEIADYVKEIAKNFFKSNYQINRLAIYNADLRYDDYAINEKFEVSASPLTIIADSIERSDKWVNLSLRSHLKPYGKLSLDLSINPKDSSDFNINYNLSQMSAAMFNPYLITFTSFPLDRGTMELKGTWHVNNGIIKSANHFLMIDPRISDKQKKDGARWMPLHLVMFFVRERGNVIDYEIPIIGDLKDPKFKLKDVFLDALTNLFVKPVTTPYRVEVKNLENKIERSFALNWEMRKSALQDDQEKFLKKLIEHLKDDRVMNITVTPINYAEKEKEYLLFFEAKKLFYLDENNLSERSLVKEDTIMIDKIPVKDSSFVHYLNKHSSNGLLFTIQDKCEGIVGLNKVNSLYHDLTVKRKNKFMAYFERSGTAGQIKFMPPVKKIPYNGFSVFEINYKNEWPDDLKKAYYKLMDLDNKSPRDKFKEERESYKKMTAEK